MEIVTEQELNRISAQLAQECMSGRLVLFAGAGCSISVGLPSWTDLLDDLMQEQGIKTREQDPLRIAARLEKKMHPLPFREGVANRLRRPSAETSDLLDAFADLPVDLLFTTNYDHILEDRLRRELFDVQVIRHAKDIPSINRQRKTVVKLHGDIDAPSSLIVTGLDYAEYEEKNKDFFELLKSELTLNTFLFVGTSFLDPRPLRADEIVFQRFGRFRRPAYIILIKPKIEGDRADETLIIEGDFKAFCEDLRDRALHPIVFEHTEDVPGFLREIKRQTIHLNKDQKEPVIENLLLQDRVKRLESELRGSLERKCDALIRELRGQENALRPNHYEAAVRANELVIFLRENEENLSPKLRFDGWATACDTFSRPQGPDLEKARHCYEKALGIVDKLDSNVEEQARLRRVRAKLLFSEGKGQEAIASLDPEADPKTAGIWLSLLIDSGREEETVRFVETHEVDPAWAGAAIWAMVATGRLDQAEEMRRQTLVKFDESGPESDVPGLDVSYAEALLMRAVKLCGLIPGKSGRIKSRPKGAEQLLLRAIHLAEPVAENPRFTIETLIGVRARFVCMQANDILGVWDSAANYAKDLIDEKPLRESVAYVLLNRSLQSISNDEKSRMDDVYERLCTRLDEQFPERLWALNTKAIIRWKYFNEPETSFDILKGFEHAVGTDHERHMAAIILNNCAAEINRIEESESIIRNVLPRDDPFIRAMEARELHRKGNLEEAYKAYESILPSRDDPDTDITPELYLRLGKIAMEKEEWKDARQKLIKAEEELKEQSVLDPFLKEVLDGLLFVATQLGDAQDVLGVTERMEKRGYGNENARFVKAQALLKEGRLEEARVGFTRLNEDAEPKKAIYAVWLANTLLRLGRPDEAAKQLAPFCNDDEKFDLDALCLWADIQFSLERAEHALEKMKNLFARLEDDPRALMLYMRIAHAAGDDQEGNRALTRIIELQDAGKVPDGVLKAVSIDEMKKYATSWNQTLEDQTGKYQKAQVTREHLISFQNLSVYHDWAIRTQELPPGVSNHHLVVYSTHGVRPFIGETNELRVLPFEVSENTREIVVSYDALITLHRLELLEVVSRRFDRIFYLDEYTFLFNRQASKAREMLFYGLLEQAVRIDPLSYK